MDELQALIDEQKELDPDFAENFDEGYEHFKLGVLLRQTREQYGISREEMAGRLRTKKSTVARIENHSEDVRLATLMSYTKALGKEMHVVIT